MGAGASAQTITQSHARLRKALILKAYKNRASSTETFQDQFQRLAFKKEGASVQLISFTEVRKYLSLEARWVEDLFGALGGSVS
jgi:hypothetical protein